MIALKLNKEFMLTMTVCETSAIKLFSDKNAIEEETVKLKKKSIYTVIMLKLL